MSRNQCRPSWVETWSAFLLPGWPSAAVFSLLVHGSQCPSSRKEPQSLQADHELVHVVQGRTIWCWQAVVVIVCGLQRFPNEVQDLQLDDHLLSLRGRSLLLPATTHMMTAMSTGLQRSQCSGVCCHRWMSRYAWSHSEDTWWKASTWQTCPVIHGSMLC